MATPSFVESRIPHANPIFKSFEIVKADGNMKAKEIYRASLTLQQGTIVDVDTVNTQKLNNNMLSFSDYVRQEGPVVLTQKGE